MSNDQVNSGTVISRKECILRIQNYYILLRDTDNEMIKSIDNNLNENNLKEIYNKFNHLNNNEFDEMLFSSYISLYENINNKVTRVKQYFENNLTNNASVIELMKAINNKASNDDLAKLYNVLTTTLFKLKVLNDAPITNVINDTPIQSSDLNPELSNELIGTMTKKYPEKINSFVESYIKGFRWFADMNINGNKVKYYFKILKVGKDGEGAGTGYELLALPVSEAILDDKEFRKNAEVLIAYDQKSGNYINNPTVLPDFHEYLLQMGLDENSIGEIYETNELYRKTNNEINSIIDKDEINILEKKLNDLKNELNKYIQEKTEIKNKIEEYSSKIDLINNAIKDQYYRGNINKGNIKKTEEGNLKKLRKDRDSENNKLVKNAKSFLKTLSSVTDIEKKLNEKRNRLQYLSYQKQSLYDQLEKKKTGKLIYNYYNNAFEYEEALLRSFSTFCNWLVTTSVALHYKELHPNERPLNLYIKDGKEQGANAIVDNLENEALDILNRYRIWEKIDAQTANNIINTIDSTIVAGWRNPEGGSGHVAILWPGYLPIKNEIFDEKKIKIYHTGGKDPRVDTIGNGFGNRSPIKYFILIDDYNRYKKYLKEHNGK